MIPTRGERKCNPGNLDRNTTQWQGMCADQSADQRFVVFDTPEAGIRALAKVLLSYYHKHGLNTVQGIIDRWAPPGENDTGSYVNHVAGSLGVGKDAALNLDDQECLEALCKAIILHENGRVIYSDAIIAQAVESAIGG